MNGVIEDKDTAQVKIDTAKKPAKKSMQAEAQHTADQELEDEWGGLGEKGAPKEADNDDEDQGEEDGAYLLEGFDSDASDVEDVGYDGKPRSIPKKARKEVQKLKEKSTTNEPGVVYLGKIPHGFYEAEMRSYLAQFGDITKLRLSRNKRTGASKHFAFIEFASKDVAKIVAETMNKYLLYQHVMVCNVVDPATLHKDTWKGANKKFRKIPHDKIEREKLAAPKTVEEWEKKNEKEQKKRDKMAKKLNTIGYDIPAVTLKDPQNAVEQGKSLKQKLDASDKGIEDGTADDVEEPAKAIEAPKETVVEAESKSEDADAEMSSKKSKKDKKKGKKAKEEVAEASVKSVEAPMENSVEDVKVPDAVVNEDVDDTEKSSKKSKKDKKSKKAKEEDAEASLKPVEALEETFAEAAKDVEVPEAIVNGDVDDGEKSSKKDKKDKKKAKKAKKEAVEPAIAKADEEATPTADADTDTKSSKKASSKTVLEEAESKQQVDDHASKDPEVAEKPKEKKAKKLKKAKTAA